MLQNFPTQGLPATLRLTRRQFIAYCPLLSVCYAGESQVHSQVLTNFVDPEWRNDVECLLAAINATFSHPDYVRPKAILQGSDLPNIGASLANGTYRPDEWLQRGDTARMEILRREKPPIHPKSDYCLLTLRALREAVSRIGMRFGGIVYEDPFYALLACFNVGVHHRFQILPRVTSVDQAWEQRSTILSSLVSGSYKPEEHFVDCLPVGQNRTGLPMTSLTVSGDLLQQLLQVGGGTIRDSNGFSRYALYEFVPEK